MSLLANPISSINKTGVISPRYNVRITDFEKWVVKLLPSRQFGYIVLTTSSGIMDHEEARRKHVAGKILGQVMFPPMHWSDTNVVLPVSSTSLYTLRIGIGSETCMACRNSHQRQKQLDNSNICDKYQGNFWPVFTSRCLNGRAREQTYSSQPIRVIWSLSCAPNRTNDHPIIQ